MSPWRSPPLLPSRVSARSIRRRSAVVWWS
jgi:hypothetical protein